MIFAVAPMMQHTTLHFRVAMRHLTRRALLYTEMVHSHAVLHGPRALLRRDPGEGRVALQLGGNDPAALQEAARRGVDQGFDEIDLNVGCPSERVSSGAFGACLMKEPERVATLVGAVRAAVSVPVTVKHRIGVDDLDAYEDLLRFVDTVARAGPARFTVHARKAWLSGLSPEQNRTLPPLRHGDVHRLKRERPGLTIVINGGLRSLTEARPHLASVDGVMCGRAAIEDPWPLLSSLDAAWFGDAPSSNRRSDAVRAYLPFASREAAAGQPWHRVMRPWIPIFAGCRGNRLWRRALADTTTLTLRRIEQALDTIDADLRDPTP